MNILPKKSWHVFKPENVEKVLKDEAAARGKEAERFEAELEAQKDLRKARLLSLQADGSHTAQKFTSPGQAPAVDKPSKSSTVSHLNLFEGADFDIGSKARKLMVLKAHNELNPADFGSCRRQPTIIRGCRH